MKSLNSEYQKKQAITHNLLQTIRRIAEYKGKQDLYKEQSPQVLETLRQAALYKVRNLPIGWKGSPPPWSELRTWLPRRRPLGIALSKKLPVIGMFLILSML